MDLKKSPLSAVPRKRKPLLKMFWLLVFGLVCFQVFNIGEKSLITVISSILVAFAVLLPSYLWCSGKALGMPIFPLFALPYLWAYSMQFLIDNSAVSSHSPENHLSVALTVTGPLLLATLVWFQFVKSPSKAPRSYRIFSGQEGGALVWGSFIMSLLFHIAALAGWLTILEGRFFSLVNAIMLAIGNIAVFILAYRCGRGKEPAGKTVVFWLLMAFYLLATAAGLLLIYSMTIFTVASVAYIVAHKKVPWVAMTLVMGLFWFLHVGKTEMREQFWTETKPLVVKPLDYPRWYAEWAGYSLDHIRNKSSNLQIGTKSNNVSILERSSLLQLLLLAQSRTPNEIPYLRGATYAVIPQLLVPRFLNPAKGGSHEGTYLLNIHYGLQTRADTLKTTIGWGLLNEAYANFGFMGCGGLAVVLGFFYGLATRWCLYTPVFAPRSLFGITLIGLAFQAEFSAGVYVAALFQSTMTLLVLSLFFTKSQIYKPEDTALY